ncbi:MAG: DinB family protein [Anaerolineales bacterium]|jgi:hypothetical protein
MISIQELLDAYEHNLDVLKRQTIGLSQEDSLLQLPFRANCLNWVVGHILTNRINVLKMLGIEQVLPDVDLSLYYKESEPILGPGPGVLVLSELLGHLETTQKQLEAALSRETPESLQRQASYSGRPERTLAAWLLFLFYHDCYHLGQTELLRQAAGTDDKVV